MALIRAPIPEDVLALLPLVQGLAAHHGDVARATAQTLQRDLFGSPPWAQCLVAEQDGKLVAYAAMIPLAQVQHGARGMDLHHLFIASLARGTGLGRRMVRAVQAHATALGCSYMTVSTTPQNLEAQAFYTHLGFAPSPSLGVRFACSLKA